MMPGIATRPAVPTLARAKELQQAGRLGEATRLYREILDQDADHLEALYLAGAAALGLDRVDEGARLLERAVRQAPRVALFHYHLGLAYRLQERLEEAEARLHEAVRLQPDRLEAHTALASVAWSLVERSAAGSDIARWRRRIMQWRLTIANSIKIIEAAADADNDTDAIMALGRLYACLSDIPRRRGCAARLQRLRERQYRTRPGHRPGRRYFELSVTNIGEYAILDMLEKRRQLGWSTDEEILVLCHRERIVNRAYLAYWEKYFRLLIHDGGPAEALVPPGYVALDQKYVLDLPNGEVVRKERYHNVAQAEWEAQGRAPLLSLRDEHRARGWAALEACGVPPDAWLVTLHVREGGYRYESERAKHEARNADILTYLPAIQEITARGGWVIRLGHAEVTPLPELPQVIDYARGPLKADWMDVFLIATCRFFVGTDSGPCHMPASFGVPAVLTNVYPASARPWSGGDLYIPKLLRSQVEERNLSFRELFDPPHYDKAVGSMLAGLKIAVVDNSRDEISEVVVEMMDRLDGGFATSDADDALQRQFDDLDTHDSYGVGGRVGREFLRRHEALVTGA